MSQLTKQINCVLLIAALLMIVGCSNAQTQNPPYCGTSSVLQRDGLLAGLETSIANVKVAQMVAKHEPESNQKIVDILERTEEILKECLRTASNLPDQKSQSNE